jgi:hypothetical protein
MGFVKMFWLVILAACCVGLYLRFTGQSVDGAGRQVQSAARQVFVPRHGRPRRYNAQAERMKTALDKSDSARVAEVSLNMNSIPTGTPIAARGVFLQVRPSGGEQCEAMLDGRHLLVQHGELDPASYCRFGVLLRDANENQLHYLVCGVGLAAARDALRRYTYGEPLVARGRYAASLDFTVEPLLLDHVVGVPALDSCTVVPGE